MNTKPTEKEATDHLLSLMNEERATCTVCGLPCDDWCDAYDVVDHPRQRSVPELIKQWECALAWIINAEDNFAWGGFDPDSLEHKFYRRCIDDEERSWNTLVEQCDAVLFEAPWAMIIVARAAVYRIPWARYEALAHWVRGKAAVWVLQSPTRSLFLDEHQSALDVVGEFA